jgi:two-component system LytT family response regulator
MKVMHELKKEESYKTHFLVPAKGDKLIPISVNDILFFYISDGIVKAVDRHADAYIFSQSLDELVELLNPRDFFRVNRQYLIAKKAITDVSLWFNGRLVINLKVPVPEKIIVSKAKVSEFKDWF